MADIAVLTQLIEPEAKALGFDLVRVAMLGGTSDPTLQVMAERPETRQLVIEDCMALSRRLSEVLDEKDPIEYAYRLEVSSPGIDRPLTRLADYADWAGFDARVKLLEAIEGRKQFDARIERVEGEAIHFTLEKEGGALLVPFVAIMRAKLLLTDALIAATAPLSAEGADEFVEERD